MNIKKELLKQKKKALVLMVSAIVGTTTLSGCGDNTFDYQYEEDGTVMVEGTISYVMLKNAKLVHLTNELAEIDEYLLVRYHPGRYTSDTYYYDIENGFEFYLESDKYKNFKMDIILDSMVDFLYKYDMIKDEYSIDDVKQLKQLLLEEDKLFKDNLETSSVKVLSKKKVES